MLKKLAFSPLMVPLLVLVFAASSFAQTTASIQGTVSDQSGAAVVGAKVTVKNTALGIERTTQTSSTGSYEVPALPPGTYSVQVQIAGFETQLAKNLVLQVSQNSVQNFGLKVASTSEVVTVEATAPAIETTTMTVGQTINQRTVQEIPLNGRHFVDLGLLIPGSVTPPQNGFLTAPLRGQGSFAINTAGNREDTVNFMVNGINLNDMVQNQITFQPSINTVSEFKVDNSTYSAEFGRNSGAIVNIATRSGENNFHGEVFEFIRNNALDARNFFNPVGQTMSPFKRNQFGAAFGGPIKKDKTFFFLSYEGLRQRQGLTLSTTVLPNTGTNSRASVTAGGNATSQAILGLIPTANDPTGTKFLGSATAPVDIQQGTADISHNISNNVRLHGYYAGQHDLRQEPILQGNTLPGFGDTRESKRQIATVSLDQTLTSSMVNEARLGFNRIHITFSPNDTRNPVAFGIQDGNNFNAGLPQISINGTGINLGGPSGFPQGRGDTTAVLGDTLSYIRGKHSFKFGGEFRRFYNNNFNGDTGALSFNSVTDFAAGKALTFSLSSGNLPSRIATGEMGFFGQDSWKFSQRLTLELGLRYDWNQTPTEALDRFSNLIVTGGQAPPFGNPLAFNGVASSATSRTTYTTLLADAKAGGLAPTVVDPNFKNSYIESYNLNIQQQISRNWSMMVGYFGSEGHDLRTRVNLNQFIGFGPGPTFTGIRPFAKLSASSPILPGANVGNISDNVSNGNSTYNALWISSNMRPWHGLQFNASYTYSKSIDYTSQNGQGVVVQDSLNPAGDRGLSDFDARNRFVVNFIYDLPALKHNRVFEGWQVGSIISDQSGNPLDLVVTGISGFTGLATLRPDQLGPVQILNQPLANGNIQYFAPSVCVEPCSGSTFGISTAAGSLHFGNMGRNSIIGPGFNNVDFSLIKKTKINERFSHEMRFEAFDILNHPNFGQPGRGVQIGSTTFGVISNTRFATGDSGSSRQLQFAMKLKF